MESIEERVARRIENVLKHQEGPEVSVLRGLLELTIGTLREKSPQTLSDDAVTAEWEEMRGEYEKTLEGAQGRVGA